MYTDPRVIEFITRHFVPARVHAVNDKDEFKRLGDKYDAHWTPTTLVVDAGGTERHRIEGFLPADDFLSQLALGVAKAAFAHQDYGKAEELYREVTEGFPDSDAAPEAQYWRGVSRYRVSNDALALKDTASAFSERYQDSAWAKKASVWK